MPNVKAKIEVANSQRQLASALKRSQSAIAQWIKDDRWPFPRKAPWNVEAVKGWASIALEKSSGDVGAGPAEPGSSALTKARTLKTIKEVKRIDIQIGQLTGKLVEREAISAEFKQVLIRLKNDLLGFSRQLADALEIRGLVESSDKIKCEAVSKQHVERLFEKFEASLRAIADDGIPAADNAGRG